MIPTRWRMRVEDQLAQATNRIAAAEAQLARADGAGALQGAYQAVVEAATLRVWHATPPWLTTVSPDEMRQRVRDAFPNLFAALGERDLASALTSPWTVDAAAPYVAEAKAFVINVAAELRPWLSAD
jgi:hypothetical protein